MGIHTRAAVAAPILAASLLAGAPAGADSADDLTVQFVNNSGSGCPGPLSVNPDPASHMEFHFGGNLSVRKNYGTDPDRAASECVIRFRITSADGKGYALNLLTVRAFRHITSSSLKARMTISYAIGGRTVTQSRKVLPLGQDEFQENPEIGDRPVCRSGELHEVRIGATLESTDPEDSALVDIHHLGLDAADGGRTNACR